MAAVFPIPLRAISGFPWAVLAVASVLVITYLAIIAVALFHPRPAHRRDARQVLDRHVFSRRPRQP